MTTTHNPWAWTPPPLPTTLSARIAGMVNGLVASALKLNVPGGMPYAMLMVVVTRIGDLGRQVRALVEALQAGTLRTRRSPMPGLTRAKRGAVAADPEAVPVWPLPRRFAWALGLVPDAACFGEDLRRMLAEPEMLALMAASPRLVRRLRSLCWMLAVELPKPTTAPVEPDASVPHAVPEHAGPEHAGPDDAVPAHAGPDDAVPDDAVPVPVGEVAGDRASRWGAGDARLR